MAENPELCFRAGLPGFPGERWFTLMRWGASEGPFSVMVDLANPDVRFLVALPEAFFPSFSVDLSDELVDRLGLTSPDDALVLVIVTLGERPSDATANLLGPVIINIHTREAVQAVLHDSGYSTGVPLISAATAA